MYTPCSLHNFLQCMDANLRGLHREAKKRRATEAFLKTLKEQMRDFEAAYLQDALERSNKLFTYVFSFIYVAMVWNAHPLEAKRSRYVCMHVMKSPYHNECGLYYTAVGRAG